MQPKHDGDFYGWTMAEANLLRQRRIAELDFDNLMEKLESMGASEKRELIKRMSLLIMHLLKWQYQPVLRGRRWLAIIEEKRLQLKEVFEDSPSLNSFIDESIVKAYKHALLLIKKETSLDLKLFSQKCPYTYDQIMDDEFYPE